MNFFTKTILIISAFILSLTSCAKKQNEDINVLALAINESATISLSKADFTTQAFNMIIAQNGNYYESGLMEFKVNGVSEATFEFTGAGNGILNKNGAGINKKLQSKKDKYTKIILSPLIKVANCDYIVQGIVTYYDENNVLVATIDFGDGTCDEWAVKSFPNKPDYTFSQDDWLKK